jgi:hypothetical protein
MHLSAASLLACGCPVICILHYHAAYDGTMLDYPAQMVMTSIYSSAAKLIHDAANKTPGCP